MTKFLRRGALFIVANIVAFHVFILCLHGLNTWLQYNLPNTYVAEINTPGRPTMEILKNLNEMNQGTPVRFKGTRPIYISMDELPTEKNNKTLGVAYIFPWACYIKMDNKLSKWEYEVVLWHEYIHCFGYGHSMDERDIMAPNLAFWIRRSSVNHYLREISKIYE